MLKLNLNSLKCFCSGPGELAKKTKKNKPTKSAEMNYLSLPVLMAASTALFVELSRETWALQGRFLWCLCFLGTKPEAKSSQPSSKGIILLESRKKRERIVSTWQIESLMSKVDRMKVCRNTLRRLAGLWIQSKLVVQISPCKPIERWPIEIVEANVLTNEKTFDGKHVCHWQFFEPGLAGIHQIQIAYRIKTSKRSIVLNRPSSEQAKVASSHTP